MNYYKHLNQALTATILLAIIGVDVTCKKSQPDPYNTLPPLTQQGKGTFGCIVNGKVWVPHYPCALTPAYGGCPQMHYTAWPIYERRYSNGTLPIGFTIYAGRIEDNIATNMQITPLYDYAYNKFKSITTTGNYTDSFEFVYNKTDKLNGGWEIFTPGAGNRPRIENFTITKVDTINHFIAGIFNFTLYVKNSNNEAIDSVVVTDGRFDLPFAEEACTCSPN